jgi:hypothetical protein
MQLGSRFSPGQAPGSLPPVLLDEIAAVEAGLSDQERDTLRWTLTWLEGRPIVELDNGIRLGEGHRD